MTRYAAVSLALCLISAASGVFAAVKPVVQPSITPDQAAVLALNRVSSGPEGIAVQHRRHDALFTPEGFEFDPMRGPHWSWALDYIGPASGFSANKAVESVTPIRFQPDVISYARAGISERYVIGHSTIEQRFVIAQPLALNRADLLVAGRVLTQGKLENRGASGWLWRDEQGVVTLGQVTVFDAKGKILPATMQVAQNTTRIRVDGKALATAAYPVTIDPVIGSELRISDMGADGNSTTGAVNPDVAYNSTDNEYLVVWWGDDVDQDFEVFGQRIDAVTGTELGIDFQISTMAHGAGVLEDAQARDPAVTYNSDDNEYLVVWEGTAPLSIDGQEIFGRVVGADGTPLGTQTRISLIGDIGGDSKRAAANPDVCYNTTTKKYLVVYRGDVVDLANEIFGRLVDSALVLSGDDDMPISTMGIDNTDTSRDGDDPAVACNPTGTGEYYVVWWGDDVEDQDMEIYGRRLDAAGAGPATQTKISATGGTTNDGFWAQFPEVAYNSVDNQYLVVWQGGDTTSPVPVAGNEFNIYGQLIDATNGSEIADDFQISFVGGIDREARFPAVAHNAVSNEYLVVWEADEESNDAFEIYARAVPADGSVDSSVAGLPISGANFGVEHPSDNAGPAIAFGATAAQHLVAWEDDRGSGEFEIFTRRASDAIFRLTTSAVTVAEDVGTATITVERFGNTENVVTVDIATTGGTAGVTDFTDASATLNFAINDVEESISISITDDTVDENDETVNISLSNPLPAGGAVLAATGTTAVLTITDNDTGGDTGGGTSSDSDGGGGCSLGSSDGFDPLFPLLMLIALGYLLRRSSYLN